MLYLSTKRFYWWSPFLWQKHKKDRIERQERNEYRQPISQPNHRWWFLCPRTFRRAGLHIGDKALLVAYRWDVWRDPFWRIKPNVAEISPKDRRASESIETIVSTAERKGELRNDGLNRFGMDDGARFYSIDPKDFYHTYPFFKKCSMIDKILMEQCNNL